MEHESINIADLKLDGGNPRHVPATSQRDIIAALLDEGGRQLVGLAADIAVNGPSPIDVFLVVKEGSAHTVVEGNRRLAAIKLLMNPNLTDKQKYRKRFAELSKGLSPIHEVRCAVARNRAEARHWQELRHTGTRGGAGTVPWGTEASTRFHGKRGTQAERALIFIDAIQAAYKDNAALMTDVDLVRQKRLTTLGRFVSDPDARRDIGISFEDGNMEVHYSDQQIEAAAVRIFQDFAGAVSVSEVDSKELRRKYLVKIGPDMPDRSTYIPAGRSLGVAPQKQKKQVKKAPGPTPPAKPFDGVHLANLGGRVAAVLDELRSLDLDTYPNTAGVLLRVVIDLAIGQVYETKGLTRAQEFKDDIRNCARRIDPSEKDPKYAAVRTGLQDGSSVMAAKTMHAYLHNPHYHPTPTEIRQTAANYAAFLAGLDTLV